MKKINLAIVISLLSVSLAGCSQISPGNVGVRVNQYGSGAGVESKPLGVGTYWTGPGTTIEEYPISTKNYTWTKSNEEGNDKNEEFSFQDRSGLIVTGDVSIAYHVDPMKAPILYQKYRMDMDSLIEGPLRSQVRSAIVNVASHMSVEEIYGSRKTELINNAAEQVRRFFEPSGLVIEQMYWAGPIRIPDSILQQINERTKNEQAALAAQANLETVKANAQSRIEEARGAAEAQRLESDSLKQGPELVKKMWIDKWDGHMPQTVYCNSATPCITTGQ